MKKKKPAVPPRYGVRYPWRRWFGKPRFRLVKGIDYHISMVSMRQMCMERASKFRLSVETELVECEGVIIVKVVGTLPAEIRKKKRRA